MSATGFSTRWLELRYPFDASARSITLSQQFVQQLSGKENVSILDLGAGIGSNVKYFHDRIEANQDWYLVELDPGLIKHGIQSLTAYFAKLGYVVQKRDYRLHLVRDIKINITFVLDSILHINPFQYQFFDGILANALLDVLTSNQVRDLLDRFSDTPCPKLFSIIYEDMQWMDDDPENHHYVRKYHEHMQRQQPHGRALGPGCIPFLQNQPDSDVYHFHESTWEIRNEHKAMLEHLLAFYQRSIPELLTNQADQQRFKDWLAGKTSRIASNELHVQVKHRDMFWL